MCRLKKTGADLKAAPNCLKSHVKQGDFVFVQVCSRAGRILRQRIRKIEEAEKENRKTRITKNGKIICTPAQLHRSKMA